MNLSLGRIKGIKIQVHFTFWFILIWGAFRYGGNGRFFDAQGLLYGATLTLLLFGIVLLHELGHSFAALRFNIPVRDITLLPIGGLARLERMPDKPFQEFVVALAGPAVNVVLFFLFIPVVWLVIQVEVGWAWLMQNPNLAWRIMLPEIMRPGLTGLILNLSLVNISLLVFNMIPAFPLDGGRVFRALLAMVLGNEKATPVAVWVGRTFAILLGIYGLYTRQFFTALIALFIFSAGGAEGRAVKVRSRLKGISVRHALSRVGSVVLQPHFTLTEVASLTLYSHQENFPVMLGDALIGIIRRQQIRQALQEGKSTTAVAELMQRDFPSLAVDDSLSHAQDQLMQAQSNIAAVYEDRHFIGLLSFDDIERAFYQFTRRGPAPQTI